MSGKITQDHGAWAATSRTEITITDILFPKLQGYKKDRPHPP